MRVRAAQRHHEQLIPAIEILGVPADVADNAQSLDTGRAGTDIFELGLRSPEIGRRRRDLRHGGPNAAHRLVDDLGVLGGQVHPVSVERKRFPLFGGQGGRVRGIGDDAQGVNVTDGHVCCDSPFPRYLTGYPLSANCLRIASSVTSAGQYVTFAVVAFPPTPSTPSSILRAPSTSPMNSSEPSGLTNSSWSTDGLPVRDAGGPMTTCAFAGGLRSSAPAASTAS